nr:hypothetical protein [Tanacetum cinerariifolium]
PPGWRARARPQPADTGEYGGLSHRRGAFALHRRHPGARNDGPPLGYLPTAARGAAGPGRGRARRPPFAL